MAQRKTLNDAQVAVLRWIANGCPDDGVDSVSARISAGALRNRGLVHTKGRGPTWQATITTSGSEYLKRLDGPNPPIPRQANVSVTQQLVNDVIAAGGSLRVPRKHWNQPDGIDYERRARLAETHGKVPNGSRLRVTVVDRDELLVELVGDPRPADDADHGESALPSIPVPARLRKYHRVASELASRTGLHEMSRKALPRVQRLVHALATEAERRGYDVACIRVESTGYDRNGWKPARDGQLVFTINGHPLKVRIWEKGCGLRAPYEDQMSRWKRDREQPYRLMQFEERPKPYDSGATGELNIEVVAGGSGRQKSWGDRSRWQIEDRLPHVLRELELQAAEAEERRLAREREQAERQQQWEAAMEQAKRRAIEAHRIDTLRQRIAAWEEADAIRRYCDAVEAQYGEDAIAAHPAAAEWLAFARERADRAQQLPDMPPDPEITNELLKPYLGRWSPYGPQHW